MATCDEVYSPYRDVGGTRHKETTFPCLYQQFISTLDTGCQLATNSGLQLQHLPSLDKISKENCIINLILSLIT